MEQKIQQIVSEIENVMMNNSPSPVPGSNNKPILYVPESSNECNECNEYLSLGNAYKKQHLYSS